jgi:protein-tyrosine-phosphatase
VLLPLQRHRAELSRLARLAIPDDRAIEALFDKHATRELARRASVPVAAGRLVQPGDTADAVLAEFGSPVVVKPRRSYSLDSLAARGKVRVVSEPARLARLLSEAKPDETLLEQYFTGQGVGISLLASRGRVLQAFQHHRAREIAGASFYRYSAALSPDLAAACETIVENLEYTGLAMFEFKRNADADWVLLEVNARPWGSMPLPVALGVDFPYLWYRLLTAGEERPAVRYRIGVYGRNLVPDLQMSLVEAQERRLGPIAATWFMTGRAAELLYFVTGREVHDVLGTDDFRPGLSELGDINRAVWRRLETRLPGGDRRRRNRAATRIRAMRQSLTNPRVMFVCQGNICRSPFAAAMLRARVADRRIAIASAGMMPQPGRRTPSLGLEAAAAHGIDLAAHRSMWLTRALAQSASMLVVFDEITRSAVLDRYPDLHAPLIRLGDLAGLGEIADPIEADAAGFQVVYDQIAASITALVPLLEGARSRSAKTSPSLARRPQTLC